MRMPAGPHWQNHIGYGRERTVSLAWKKGSGLACKQELIEKRWWTAFAAGEGIVTKSLDLLTHQKPQLLSAGPLPQYSLGYLSGM